MWQVIGHSQAVSFLQRGLAENRLSHAYLFSGPPQVGKMTLAREFAKALNCLGDEPPCGHCRSCLKIDAEQHPDVQVIRLLTTPGRDGEERQKKVVTIDQVRAVRREVYLPPYEGRKKVYIFERAEQLMDDAANALLKTLEEPPANVILILLAANDKLLLPTIVSRCQIVRLTGSSPAAIGEALRQRWGLSPEKAELLSRVSGGLPGKAIAALEDKELWQEREETMRRIGSLLHSGRHDRFDYARGLANTFGRNREAVYETLSYWLSWWRDLLLIKGGCAGRIANVDCEDVLQREARGITLRQVVEFIGKVLITRRQLDANSNPMLTLEVLMLNLPFD